jgi:hypothetical protein
VGLVLGAPLGQTIGPAADYLAIAILIGFGVLTLLRSGGEDDERAARMVTARGPTLLGLLRVPVLPFLVAIGGQAFVASQFGFRLGASVSERSREGAERLAGSPSSPPACSSWRSASCRVRELGPSIHLPRTATRSGSTRCPSRGENRS